MGSDQEVGPISELLPPEPQLVSLHDEGVDGAGVGQGCILGGRVGAGRGDE